jgi:NAD(P)-dependent dehydrogenase (short-subunit alcohol dehydrogenase family)
MRTVLIIGANRGLGHSLTTQYAKQGMRVYATARYAAPQAPMQNVHWFSNIDIERDDAGRRIVVEWSGLDAKADLLILCANYYAAEAWGDLSWDKEISMYKTCAIGPLFLIQYLVAQGILKTGSRIVLVNSEQGSISLRHESEGAQDFGGHASRAAKNMIGKLLSIQLKPQGIPVALVHTGYVRKQNKDGFFEPAGDKHGMLARGPYLYPTLTWAFVAVKPDVAAAALIQWIEGFDMSKTGEFWAVRGPGYVLQTLLAE